MDRQTKQSLVISLMVHLAFIMAGIAIVFFESWLDKPEPVVFELVAGAPSPVVNERSEEPQEETPLEPIRTEPLEPVKPVPELPDLPQPQPEPEPVRKLSFEEWARNRELPERVQRVQQPERRQVEAVPEIQTDVRSRLQSELPPIQIQGIDLSQINSADALQRYLAQLRASIQQAFTPTGSNLQAEAYFQVTAGGRIQDIRIHQSSGDPVFDQSVLRTLRTARTPGPPPGSRDYTFSLVFRGE